MNLKYIADKLTTELTGNLNYVVTDDVQYFNNSIRDNGERYVPVVISVENSFTEQAKQYYSQTYTLRFHVLQDDRDVFISDIETFINSQTTEAIDSYYVQKVYQALQYEEETTLNGVDYFVYTLQTTWFYALSVIGSYATILFDAVSVPYRTCEIVHDIAYVSNESRKSNYRMTNDIVVIVLPLILSNTKILEIYNEVNSDYYNKEYTVSIYGEVRTLALKKANIRLDSNVALSTITLTLETAYPRVAITLDGETIPNTSYSYSMKKQISTAAKVTSLGTSDLIKGYVTGKARTYSMTFVKDASTVYAKIVADAYGSLTNQTYELIRDGITYTLILAEARESYTETGDMAMECQFVEYGI